MATLKDFLEAANWLMENSVIITPFGIVGKNVRTASFQGVSRMRDNFGRFLPSFGFLSPAVCEERLLFICGIYQLPLPSC